MSIVGADGREIRKPHRKANDLATLHEVATMIYHETAPLGMLMKEFMEKLARCEDALGITDESAASMPVPRGTPLSPHAQLAAVELGLKEIPPDIAHEIVHETVNPGGDVE